MPGSFSIGKIAGIRVDINASWVIIFALLTVSLAVSILPTTAPGYSAAAYWAVGILGSLLFFASVLVHELGHSVVARSRGLDVSSITLFIFGGVSNLQQEPHSPGEEFAVAVVGPALSLVIGVVCLVLGQALGPAHSIVAAMLVYLGSTNLLLGIFNLIPGFPLDGGRVLRSIIWRVTGNLRTATRWASRIGQVIAYLFILFGVMEFFAGNLLGGIWFGFIGWFLLSAAQTANQQVMLESMLRGVTVRDVMAPPPYLIGADSTVQQLVDGYIFPYGLRSVPVTEGDRFAGLVTLQEIRSVPQEQWPTTRVGQVMVPVAKLLTVEPGRALSDALHDMAAHDVGQVPVVADGQLVGMLSRDRVLNALAVRRSLARRGSAQPYPQPPAPASDQPRLPGGTAP
jgi:Zn-dependent protease/CBS domain-containing protein